MKLLRIIFSSMAIAAISMSAISLAEKKDPPKKYPEIPIIIYEGTEVPKTYSLIGFAEITALFSDCSLILDLPFEDYPISATVESMSGFGYWTATFTDASSCEIPFNGPVGDYQLTLTTAGNSSYTGIFSLE